MPELSEMKKIKGGTVFRAARHASGQKSYALISVAHLDGQNEERMAPA